MASMLWFAVSKQNELKCDVELKDRVMIISQDAPVYQETRRTNYPSGCRQSQVNEDSRGRLRDAINIFKNFQDKEEARNVKFDPDNY